jgi:hypothetical protein
LVPEPLVHGRLGSRREAQAERREEKHEAQQERREEKREDKQERREEKHDNGKNGNKK